MKTTNFVVQLSNQNLNKFQLFGFFKLTSFTLYDNKDFLELSLK